MRNSSQNAGCMRRSPASHCCQVRQVVCTRTPAAVWDSPAASRAARTSAGAGLDSGPFGPLFGWLGILTDGASVADLNPETMLVEHALEAVHLVAFADHVGVLDWNNEFTGERAFNESAVAFGKTVELEGNGLFCGGFGHGHFGLQPLLPRGAVEKQCASHELNYTRNVRKCKNIFELFFGWPGETAKPSNA